MAGLKYLIALDLLGYEPLAQIVSKKKGIDPVKVRDIFKSTISKKVDELRIQGKIQGKHVGNDDWTFVLNSVDEIFIVLFHILDHDTGLHGFEQLPISIGISCAKYDTKAVLDGFELVNNDATISFYKRFQKILNHYKAFRRKTGGSPKSTFILVSDELYQKMNQLDQEKCRSVPNGEVKYYEMNLDRALERGKSLKFLSLISRSSGSVYDRINEIFVPPRNFKQIKNVLDQNKFVIISGTPEIGKTFTAIRLLWDYYSSSDYFPVWVEGAELSSRQIVRRHLEDISAILKENSIIYFEDPFGKTSYEQHAFLETYLQTIIDLIRNKKGAFVILTTREDVFKKYIDSKIVHDDLSLYTVPLNMGAYHYEQRERMLLNLAKIEDCYWLSNRSALNEVLTIIQDYSYLPTPLSIRAFTIATKKFHTIEEFNNKINLFTERIETKFAKDFLDMAKEDITFLLLVFIFSNSRKDLSKIYPTVIKNFKIEKSLDYRKIEEKFINAKIFQKFPFPSLTHPSYDNAIKHLLVGENIYKSTIIQEFYSQILLELIKTGVRDRSITLNISNYYRAIQFEYLVQIMALLASDEQEAPLIGELIVQNYDYFPQEVTDLLEIIEITPYGKLPIILSIAKNYTILPKKLRKKFFDTLKENKFTKETSWAILDEFQNFSDEIKKASLIILLKNIEFLEPVTLALIRNFSFTQIKYWKLFYDSIRHLKNSVHEYTIFKDYNTIKIVYYIISYCFVNKSDELRNIDDFLNIFPENFIYENLLTFIDDVNIASILPTTEPSYFKWTLPETRILVQKFKNEDSDGNFKRKVSESYYLAANAHILTYIWLITRDIEKNREICIKPPRRLEVQEEDFLRALAVLREKRYIDNSINTQVENYIHKWAKERKKELYKRIKSLPIVDYKLNEFKILIFKEISTKIDYLNNGFIDCEYKSKMTANEKFLCNITLPKIYFVDTPSLFKYFEMDRAILYQDEYEENVVELFSKSVLNLVRNNKPALIDLLTLKKYVQNQWKVICNSKFGNLLYQNISDLLDREEKSSFPNLQSFMVFDDNIPNTEVYISHNTFGKITFNRIIEQNLTFSILKNNYKNQETKEPEISIDIKLIFSFEKDKDIRHLELALE